MRKPGWDQYFMRMAHLAATRSTCLRRKVGAVIVSADNAVVLALGYNGNYIGGPHARDFLEGARAGQPQVVRRRHADTLQQGS